MALKFLNKKGWHTGSLRNIENVWKAEQKHDAEQKKLEELRKQIHEERERSEFRLLQEQAGLVPKQERLDFLYDSGLAVGKGSSEGFKALEPKTQTDTPSSSSAKPQQPGALFEEKPQSANDAWRKLHSDPLLLIRQREQEALARIKNNPVQMARIRKTVKGKEDKEKSPDRKERHKKHQHKKSKHHKNSSSKHHYDSEDVDEEEEEEEEEERRTSNKGKSSKYDDHVKKAAPSSEELHERDIRGKKNSDKDLKYKEPLPNDSRQSEDKYGTKRIYDKSRHEEYYSEGRKDSESARKGREDRSFSHASRYKSPDVAPQDESHQKRRNIPPKLSDEERALRLREMQMDAELHEEQRWKRLKKAEEDDAQEASRARVSSGRNFLDAAHKSVYGAEKGGSSTIEESVRRRKFYSQGRSGAGDNNAFRR